MSGWEQLAEELKAWRGSGRRPRLWWRDDDATSDQPALRRLLDLPGAEGLPLALAAIPATMEESLIRATQGRGRVALLQHGYQHKNHAAPGAKKRELGDERPLDAVLGELREGQRLGSALFADEWLPILVPPWNRIAPSVAVALPSLGFTGLSTHGRKPSPPAGLIQVNSHLDIMTWKPAARFRGEQDILADLTAMLRVRRQEDPPGDEEPIGLLTHHKVHDEEAWAFLERFFSTPWVKESVSWEGASSLFLPGNKGEREPR